MRDVLGFNAFKVEEVAVAGGVVLPASGRLLAEVLACGFGSSSDLPCKCCDHCGGFIPEVRQVAGNTGCRGVDRNV